MQHQKVSDGTITAVVGSSGSGKTAWLKQQIASSERLIVWDVEGQYTENMITVKDKLSLIQAVKQSKIRISYQARSLAEFDFFSRCAFVFAKLGAELGKHTDIVAEELADVTSPAKAPDGWGILVRRGRKYGANIYGVTQRPAESDKTLFGNCHAIHCCKLKKFSDRQYMALELDMTEKDLNFKKRLWFVHRNFVNNTIEEGNLTF